MPRLRPPPTKPAATIEREDHTTPSEAVEIELLADETGETEVELAPQPQPVPASIAPAVEVPASEENPLQKALDAQQRAEDLQRTAQRERDEAIRRAQERDEELARERGEREDAQYNSVLAAIVAEQAALDRAEADSAAFAAAGDWTAVGKAQRAMAVASSRLDRLEEGKQAFDTKRETVKPPAPEQRQVAPPPQDFEQKIAPLPETARTWLRKHPEFINDTSMNRKIGAAHNYLVDVDGKEAFSPAYFDALDERFGFKPAEPPQSEPPTPQPQRRSMPVSAPVSRDIPTASGQRQASSKVTLSAEERQIARSSFSAEDMTNEQKELLYARNKQRLARMRANGEYRQTTEQNG